MAPLRYIVQVGIPRDSGLPEDVATNTFHFEGDDGSADWDELLGGLVERVEAFYLAIDQMLAVTNGNFPTIKVYDFSDAKPRVPKYSDDFEITPGSASYPAEVALCVSYSAALESGVNMARRRGRFFLGPLNSAIGTMNLNGDNRPGSGDMAILTAALPALARGAGGGTPRLAVYSPTTHTSPATVDAAWNDVSFFWVDNAYDTIRSRGARATERQTVQLD